jgi:Domain of unknown function (DUF6430)
MTVWLERGELGGVAIPVIGTGRGRLDVPRRKVIEWIAQSFAQASRARVFANKLAIVIDPKDAREHEVNLFEVRDYLALRLHE